jgi:hypothetical protein
MPYGYPGKGENYGMSTKGRTSGYKARIHNVFVPVQGSKGMPNTRNVTGKKGGAGTNVNYGSRDGY